MSLADFIDFFLHAERHLEWFIRNYDVWIYALLFAIIFCETGLIVTPFLPGDSLLFAVGALAGKGLIQVEIITPLLLVAAIVGGVGAMTYSKFAIYNVTGAILWVGIFLGGGYYFGGLEIVQKNMKLVILGIIIVSVLPIIWEIAKAQLEKRRTPAA